MKKNLHKKVLALLLGVSAITANAQYQISNPGFEGDWTQYTQNSTSGYEPDGWHSFITLNSGGTLYNSAIENKMEESSDVRPGTDGVKSAKIWSSSVSILFWTYVTNGTITTGRINAGSTTTTDASGNYNFSDPSDYNEPFTGRPDSITSWVKFIPVSSGDQARISAIIHDNSRYQDPEAVTYTNVVAKAQYDYTSIDNDWQRISVPFTYEDGDNSPAYILITHTTNPTSGGGTKGDILYIDDVDMVYNSKLNSVSFDGVEYEDFDKDTFTYDLSSYLSTMPEEVEAEVDGVSATYTSYMVYTEGTDSGKIVVTSKGGDVTNRSNSNTYTFNISFPTAIETVITENVKVAAISGAIKVSGVTGDVTLNIYTPYGALVKTVKTSESTSISINKGVYVVQVVSADGTKVEKVIVK